MKALSRSANVRRVERALRALDLRMPRSQRTRLARLGIAAMQALRMERGLPVDREAGAGCVSSSRGPAGSTDSRRSAAGPSTPLLLLSPTVAILDFGCTHEPLAAWPSLCRRIDAGELRGGVEALLRRVALGCALGWLASQQAAGVGEVAHLSGRQVIQIRVQKAVAAEALHGVAQHELFGRVRVLNDGAGPFGSVGKRNAAARAMRVQVAVPQQAEVQAQPRAAQKVQAQ